MEKESERNRKRERGVPVEYMEEVLYTHKCKNKNKYTDYVCMCMINEESERISLGNEKRSGW